jgi:hypothetical protein
MIDKRSTREGVAGEKGGRREHQASDEIIWIDKAYLSAM